MPRSLQRHAQAALMFGAGAGLAAWLNLATIRNIAPQTRHFFIFYFAYAVNAKGADFAPRITLACAAASFARSTSRSLHVLLLLCMGLPTRRETTRRHNTNEHY